MTQKPITSLSQIPEDTYVTLLGAIVNDSDNLTSLTVRHMRGEGDIVHAWGVNVGGQYDNDTIAYSDITFVTGSVLAIW